MSNASNNSSQPYLKPSLAIGHSKVPSASSSEKEGLLLHNDGKRRCGWAGHHEDYIQYHDTEWGIPCREDNRLFEKICLEGFQAGLSWLTILRKRPHFREAFSQFNPEVIATYTDADIERLLLNKGIVRHRGKIEAVIHNAKQFVSEFKTVGSFSDFIWSFQPLNNERPTDFSYKTLSQLTQTPQSKQLSKALKKRGWKFVGPTTCYAFMQSMGLVNDHIDGCAYR